MQNALAFVDSDPAAPDSRSLLICSSPRSIIRHSPFNSAVQLNAFIFWSFSAKIPPGRQQKNRQFDVFCVSEIFVRIEDRGQDLRLFAGFSAALRTGRAITTWHRWLLQDVDVEVISWRAQAFASIAVQVTMRSATHKRRRRDYRGRRWCRLLSDESRLIRRVRSSTASESGYADEVGGASRQTTPTPSSRHKREIDYLTHPFKDELRLPLSLLQCPESSISLSL